MAIDRRRLLRALGHGAGLVGLGLCALGPVPVRAAPDGLPPAVRRLARRLATSGSPGSPGSTGSPGSAGHIGIDSPAAAPADRAAGGSRPDPVVLSAAWQRDDGRHQVGWLALPADGGALQVLAALDVPTRAHQVIADADGALLAVARRPGDWLLRWGGPGHRAQWRWADDERRYNGHMLPSPDGRWLLSTETDLLDGLGRVVRRDAASLEAVDVWPTGGRDPHQLIWAGAEAPGTLYVANGGITTLPETGRRKLALGTMDASIVRLAGRDGQRLAQWRLADPRLSLRHLARPAGPGAATAPWLAIALQAEHDAAEDRARAPVLALLDADGLRAIEAPVPLAGYGGDLCATGAGWAVSCPRVDAVALYAQDGRWLGLRGLGQAYALACAGDGREGPAGRDGGRWWVGGQGRADHRQADADAPRAGSTVSGLQIDNHWQWQAG